MSARPDHLVYAVPDLEAAVADFAERTGVTPAPGGQHLGLGTRNHLVDLGGAAYLEIIGPDVDNPAPDGVEAPFGLATLHSPRLVTWAVRPSDLDDAVAASAAAGADLGPVHAMSRRTPAGERLQWRLAAPDVAPFDGVTPFLIDWGATRHPSASGLPAVTLTGLRLRHPDPDGVRAVLRALGVEVPVDAGAPALVAELDTPRGAITLT